jgi:nucleotide-binding universal stress UspA family protein
VIHRHGPADLLGPDDTVRLAGYRPRVVAALGTLPDDEPVLAEAVATARRLDGELVLLHAVPLSFAERSVGLEEAVRAGERMLAEASTAAGRLGRVPKEVQLVRVRPHELVGEHLAADILVVGGPRAGRPDRLGPVARSASTYAPCTVVMVPRAS